MPFERSRLTNKHTSTTPYARKSDSKTWYISTAEALMEDVSDRTLKRTLYGREEKHASC